MQNVKVSVVFNSTGVSNVAGFENYSIDFDGYKTSIYHRSRAFHFMRRTAVRTQVSCDFDVFPQSWFLFLSQMPQGQVSIRAKRGELFFEPPVAVFLPPFKLIRWKQYPGDSDWIAIRGETELPVELGTDPFVFKWDVEQNVASLDDIIGLIRKGQRDAVSIPAELTGSRLARSLKDAIDLGFDSSASLEDICAELGVRPNSMSHTFRSCYGVSAKDYRNRLQVNQAIRKLSFEGMSLTDACYEAGFDEYSSFYRQFRNWLRVRPSHILPDQCL